MDADALRTWFDDYLEVLASCGRGDRDAAALLDYWGVPLCLTAGDACMTLTSDEDVVAAAQQQMDGLRAAGYHHSDLLALDVDVLNAASALCRAELLRKDGDGGDLGRLTATYFVVGTPRGPRAAAWAIHDA